LRQRFRFMFQIFALIVLCEVSVARAQTIPPVEGIYSGTLQAGAARLHLVLHLTKSSTGEWHATLDSIDQGVYAIEASALSISASKLTFDVPSVGAHYEGKILPEHKLIDGEWSQGSASLPITFQRQAAGGRKPADAVSPVEGLWQTALETHHMRLRLQLHVSHDADSNLVAALDNLDQGVSGLPATNIIQKDATFHFEIPSLAGTFDGTLDPAKNTLTGTWSQALVDHEKLEFKRSDQPLEVRRPQTPARPYRYNEEEVTFPGGAPGVTLAGTLTTPKGAGPFPVAVLVAGSGPNDRDEASANHRPFLVIADDLTRKGIAVLRYDKRGIGKSTGLLDSATTLDLAADAQAGVNFLKTRKEIDATKIGMIGHSEGGMIAPYLATRSKDIAWLVLLAAPGTNGENTLLNQSSLIGRAGGLDDEQLLAGLMFDRSAYALVRSINDRDALAEELVKLVKQTGFDSAMPPESLEIQLRTYMSPWFRFFLDYNPLPVLEVLKTPVLALYGQKDLQVPSKTNLPLMQKALQDAGNKDADVRALPELNHMFQQAFSGTPAEYPAIEETFSPEALHIMSDWIQAHTVSK
jgi:uncharacterized protein